MDRKFVHDFPRTISDLDKNANVFYGEAFESDYVAPASIDPDYKVRRDFFAKIAQEYKQGEPIPLVEYFQGETEIWRTLYKKLEKMLPQLACHEYNTMFEELVKECSISADSIPQLEYVSRFLKARTGFTLRPTAGLLPPRSFLNGLAFRVFHCTQYVRHHSEQEFTAEPDICHEILGHVPLFACPDFAEFSQRIGLASLNASDDFLEKLRKLYSFTVETGLMKERDEIKVFGAAILSSPGELKYALSDVPQLLPFDPVIALNQPFTGAEMQKVYFVADSMDDIKSKLRAFIKTKNEHCEYVIRYNFNTQTIEVVDK